MLPGEDWRAVIRRAITDDALAFLACFSRLSRMRDKSYQNEELLLAIEEFRRRSPDRPWLFPVRFDECDIPDIDIGAGRTLASLQRTDLFGDSDTFSEAATRLAVAIRRRLDHVPAAEAPPRHMARGQRASGLGPGQPDSGHAGSGSRATIRAAADLRASARHAATRRPVTEADRQITPGPPPGPTSPATAPPSPAKPVPEMHVSPGRGPTPGRRKIRRTWAAGATALVAVLIGAYVASGLHGPMPESHGSSASIARVYSAASYGFKAPNRIAADGTHVWVTNPPGNSVTELNASDGSWVATLTGARYGFNGPVGIAADGTHVWVASTNGNSVTELNASDGSPVRTLTGARYGFNGPVGIAVEGTHVWVTNTNGNSVTELNASDGSLVRTLTGASYGFSIPRAIALDGTHVWVANAGGDSVTELNAGDGSWVATLTGAKYGFHGPWGMAAEGTHVWVTNSGGNSVTELTAG